jgi:hypothetical protein
MWPRDTNLFIISDKIKIVAFILKRDASFAKLIKFPHPGYLNSEALSVATCLATLKARHNYLSVEVANTDKLFNGEVAFYCFTRRITLGCKAAIIVNNLILFSISLI